MMIPRTGTIYAVLAAVMLLSQVGIAQHNSIYFTDHDHHGHNHHDHEKNQEQTKEDCPACLITKSLSLALVVQQTDLFITVTFDHDVLRDYDQILTTYDYSLYAPRAPPTVLI